MSVMKKREGGGELAIDQEQQFILRMPEPASTLLVNDFETATNLKDKLSIELNQDHRHAVVRYAGQVYQGRLVDLPCIIESLKTTDKKMFYKTADISQMMVCTQGEPSSPAGAQSAATTNTQGAKKTAEDKKYHYNHGLTPPLKNVRKRRFRKTMKRKYMDMPEIEKEVKQLLRVDLEAISVTWDVIYENRESAREGVSGDPGGTNEGASKQDTKAIKGRCKGESHREGYQWNTSSDGKSKKDKDSRNILSSAAARIFGDLSDDSEISSSDDADDEQADQDTKSQHYTLSQASPDYLSGNGDASCSLTNVLDSAAAQAGLNLGAMTSSAEGQGGVFYDPDDDNARLGFEPSSMSHFPRDDLELSLSEDEGGETEDVNQLAERLRDVDERLKYLRSRLLDAEDQLLAIGSDEDPATTQQMERNVSQLRDDVAKVSIEYDTLSTHLEQSMQ